MTRLPENPTSVQLANAWSAHHEAAIRAAAGRDGRFSANEAERMGEVLGLGGLSAAVLADLHESGNESVSVQKVLDRGRAVALQSARNVAGDDNRIDTAEARQLTPEYTFDYFLLRTDEAERPNTPVAMRLAALGVGTEASLRARRATYAEVIAAHEKTIAGLEAELAAIEKRIASKTGEAERLLQQKNHLLSQIADKQRIAAATAVYGGLLAVFTFGASAAVGGGIAAAAGVALVSLRNDLANVERSKSAVESDLRSLKNAAKNHDAVQKKLRARLGDLKNAHAALDAAAPVIAPNAAPREALAALRDGVANDEKIIANLEAQIAVLETMKKEASGFEAALDEIIAELRDGVHALEQRVEESNRAIFSAVIDIALLAFGATTVLRERGILMSRKQLLMAGYDLLHGDLEGGVKRLLDRMLAEGLIAATGSKVLGSTLRGLLRAGAHGDYSAAVRALVSGARATLTPTQRSLLTLLEHVTDFDPTPLAQAVIDQPQLTAPQAEAIEAMLRAG